jgi:hypothetical protein
LGRDGSRGSLKGWSTWDIHKDHLHESKIHADDESASQRVFLESLLCLREPLLAGSELQNPNFSGNREKQAPLARLLG